MLFSLQLIGPEGPRSNKPYVLVVDGRKYAGQTDSEGRIRRYLPNDSSSGHLVVGDGDVVAELYFGHMDPLETILGVRKRLSNMGYAVPIEGDADDPHFRTVLAAFQRSVGLSDTGNLDDETREVIGICHDRPPELWKRRDANFKRLLALAAGLGA
jgi:hypothetical protein